MTRTISEAELRTGCAGLLDALEAGESFVVTRNGVPVGELRPLKQRELSTEEVLRIVVGTSYGSTGEHIRAEADAILGEDRVDDD